MSQRQPPLDADALKAYSFRVWNYKQGEMVALIIHLGDRLWIYQEMEGEKAPAYHRVEGIGSMEDIRDSVFSALDS